MRVVGRDGGMLVPDAERVQGDEPLRRQPQQQRSQIDEGRREAHPRAVRLDGHVHLLSMGSSQHRLLGENTRHRALR